MEVEAATNLEQPQVPASDSVSSKPQNGEADPVKKVTADDGASTAPAEDSTKQEPASKVNGSVTSPPSAGAGKEEAAGEGHNSTEDTQMKDAADAPAPESQSSSSAKHLTNGTPASNKRASAAGSARKKSSAVPEHKSKKLNRKKSRPLTHLDATPGQYYFARMKGHPPWPSIICDEAMLPHSLLTTRPTTAALPDGTFKREDYADGGKRAYERTFPIMFLHTNEFAWIPNTELTPLDPTSEEITGPAEKGKSKTLLAAYAKAAENHELDTFKSMLLEHEKAVQEDMALQEEKAAKKAEKAKRSAARKSTDAKGDVDEMDVDKDTPEKKSKKRKKTVEESEEDTKPAKTPKTATKLKLSTPKNPQESAAKKKASKPKGKTAKSGSDEEAETPKVEEKPLSAAELREIKEKKVLYYRHKLQRGFLAKDAVPKAEEMKMMSDFLSELETYPDLEGSIIRTTKIHKVLKQMNKIEKIPLEEEFKFKDRSSKLLAKWTETLASEASAEGKGDTKSEAGAAEAKAEPKKQTESTPQASTPKAAAAVNGDDRPTEAEQPQEKEAGKSAAPEATASSAADSKVDGGEGAKSSEAGDLSEKVEQKAEGNAAVETAKPEDEVKSSVEASV